jgi:hypothetical protein
MQFCKSAIYKNPVLLTIRFLASSTARKIHSHFFFFARRIRQSDFAGFGGKFLRRSEWTSDNDSVAEMSQ